MINRTVITSIQNPTGSYEIYVVVVTWARVVCLKCTNVQPEYECIYFRQITSAHVTIIYSTWVTHLQVWETTGIPRECIYMDHVNFDCG